MGAVIAESGLSKLFEAVDFTADRILARNTLRFGLGMALEHRS
jgi:hypothetical protein